MAYHTARLIVTIIFTILALSSLVTRYWFSAFFWTLLTVAIGYPFIRGGKLDLYYDSPGGGGTTTVENIYYSTPPTGSATPPAGTVVGSDTD